MPPSPLPKKYWAFISYSSKDKKWGKWLHRKLENYPIPKRFQGQDVFDGDPLGENLKPCFRDRDELPGAADIGPPILKALKDSRYLVVLCSRNSAKSKWVDKEISDYKALDPENSERILAIILDGEPNASSMENFPNNMESFPPSLRLPLEPLAGDLRKEGDGKVRGFLKVLSGMIQIDFDILYRRHERALRTRRIFWGLSAGVIMTLLAGLSIFALNKSKQLDAKNKEQQRTLDDIALSDHQSGLQAFDWGHYRESAAYYARSLSIRPDNQTITRSAVSTAIMSDSLFSKQRVIHKLLKTVVTGIDINAKENTLRIRYSTGSEVLSLLDGASLPTSNIQEWLPLTRSSQSPPPEPYAWSKASDTKTTTTITSPDEAYLYTAHQNGKINKIDLMSSTNLWPRIITQRKNYVSDLAISPCGQTLAVSDFDSNLSLVNASSGAVTHSITFDDNINFIAYSPNGFFLITTSDDGYLRAFDTGTAPILIKNTITPEEIPRTPQQPNVEFQVKNGTLSIRDTRTGDSIHESIALPKGALSSSDELHYYLSENQTNLAVGNDDGHLFLHNFKNKSWIEADCAGSISDLSISLDSRLCFVATRSRALIAYDTITAKIVWKQTFKGYVNSISLSNTGTLISAASDDFTFRIFNAFSGETVWTSMTDNCLEWISFDKTSSGKLHTYSNTYHYILDFGHLQGPITDQNQQLSRYLQKHAVIKAHSIKIDQSAVKPQTSDQINRLLNWKHLHPLAKTISPTSNKLISYYISYLLEEAKPVDLDHIVNLAPWHPLAPVSLARITHSSNTERRKRFLCQLSLKRLREADLSVWKRKRITEDAALAAEWIMALGYPEIAEQTAQFALQITPNHPRAVNLMKSLNSPLE